MGNIFKYVDEQGVEHDLNMTETVIDDSAGTATSSKRTYSGAKIEEKLSGLNTSLSQSISNLSQTVANNKSTIESALNTEITNRENAISAEATARDNAIASAIEAEVMNRNSAIETEVINRNSAIESVIATEVTNRNSAISTALADYDKKAQPLASGTDLDNVTEEGWYYVTSEITSTILNKPTPLTTVYANSAFGMRVVKTGGKIVQLVFNSDFAVSYGSTANFCYVRRKGSSWYSVALEKGTIQHAELADSAITAKSSEVLTLSGVDDEGVLGNATFKIVKSPDDIAERMHPVYLEVTPHGGHTNVVNWEYRFIKNNRTVSPGSNSYMYLTEATPWIPYDAWETRTGMSLMTGIPGAVTGGVVKYGSGIGGLGDSQTVRANPQLHYPFGVFYEHEADMQPVVQIRYI